MLMSTFAGEKLNCLDPRPEQVHVLSIARGLSRAGRYAAQTPCFLSVAQHSILVSRLAEDSLPNPRREFVLAALMNRAHEAYMGALAPEMEQALQLMAPGLMCSLRERIRFAIDARFGIDELDPAELTLISIAEREAEVWERQDLGMDLPRDLAALKRPPRAPVLMPMGPEEAMAQFVGRFLSIQGDL